MTQLEILNLAYSAQLDRWARADEFRNNHPHSELARKRVEKEVARLKELEQMIFEEENRG